MSHTHSSLQLEVDGAVARITFNRPESLNALNQAMAEGFREAISQVAANRDIRVLLLKGAGRGFMAGGDVAALAADPLVNIPGIMDPLHEGILQMAELPIPVVASLHGPVAGAGMSLALAADLAMAADNTVFQMAYCRIGASPDGSGSWHLARLVGLRKAMEITLLSDAVPAQEALRLGLVNWVVPSEVLEDRVSDLLARLASGPVDAYGRSKALLRQAGMNSLAGHLAAEKAAFLQGAQGAEFQEGAKAFLEKRSPDFHALEPHAERNTLT